MSLSPRGNSSFLTAALICLWCGAFAGFIERKCHHYFPTLLGLDDLRYAAITDLIVFALLIVPLLVLVPLRRRINLPAVAVFLCAGVLALDALTLAFPAPGRALVLSAAALAIAALLTWIFLRFENAFVIFGKFSGAIFILYLSIYLIAQPLWAAHVHKREIRAGQMAAPAGAPNVVLIIVDALRADHLSTYGYPRQTSPNLTQLASKSVVFENAIAPSSWTLPSHASMLTGRYPTEHQAGEDNWRLDGRFPTLGEAFEKHGYRTAALSGNFLLFNTRVGFGRGFQHFEDGSLLEKMTETNLGRRIHNRLAAAHLIDNVPGRQNAKAISNNALKWISSDSRPFFVTINFFDVHEPFMPPAADFHLYSSEPRPLNQYDWPPDIELPPGQMQQLVDAYDGSITYVDRQLAAFLNQLETRGVLKDTIVAITSDHGQEFGEHNFMFHGRGLYWELIHAPLIIYAPGRAPAGIRISIPVELQSLPSTLLNLAGFEHQQFPSAPLTTLWTDPKAQQNWSYPISQLAHLGESPRFPSYYGAMQSVVTPKWHYIEGGKLGGELYSCCGNETKNLAQTKEYASVATVLRSSLDAEGEITPATVAALIQDPPGKLQPVARKKRQPPSDRRRMNDLLHALGYVP